MPRTWSSSRRSIVTNRRCRTGIGLRPTSRSRNCSNAGCRKRSRRPATRAPRARRRCAPASRVQAAARGRSAPTATIAVGRSRGTRAARHLDSPVGRRICASRWARRIADLPVAAARRMVRRATCCSRDPRDVDLVRQISGRLAFEIEGRRRRRWAVDVGFGKAGVSAGRPRTTMRIDGRDVRRRARGNDRADADAARRPVEDRGRSRRWRCSYFCSSASRLGRR